MIKSALFYFGRRGRLFLIDITYHCGDDSSPVVKVIIYEVLGKYTKRLSSFSASGGAFFSSYENRKRNLESIAYYYTKENLDFYR